MPNSWSTSSESDFVRASGRRKTARNRKGKIVHTDTDEAPALLFIRSDLIFAFPPKRKIKIG